jgi:hypothetical protein
MQQCAYCKNPASDSDILHEFFHAPICEPCLNLEYEGPPTRLEFGTTAFFVRRGGAEYLEGQNADGRRFLIGRVDPNTVLDCEPERTWNWNESGPAWDVEFVAANDGLESRRVQGTTPQRCIYCGVDFECEPGQGQCAAAPGCPACHPEVQRASAQTFIGKQGFQFTERNGRWFLEGVEYRSGCDFVVGELSGPPERWDEPPRCRWTADGSIVWDCEFRSRSAE